MQRLNPVLPLAAACVSLFLPALPAAASPEVAPAFLAAKPIWPEGRENEKNLFVGFRAVFEAKTPNKVFLRATGSTLYRVFLNGEFLGHGPARGPHGYFRVDEWDLTSRLKPGPNVVAFEVAGYNANSYYLLDQPSFLQAEVVGGGRGARLHRRQGTPFRCNDSQGAGPESAALQFPAALLGGLPAGARL